ncbi:hypothetical protein D0869_05940 [Hortaea werneckii]|uniref:Autophagy-related protein 14 n=1 Tax=Hortaea werneckii TaxID=91943 RepID=A0A3M6YUI1_HORWE|nr:hypothetical protein D0869_05940 [Hortaea werneckii]RMY06724.1 hypothetical protein D0868_05717 [Hortaea werneckii]
MAANPPPPAPTPDGSMTRRDRPWLAPYNRKLRNLTCLSIRNLSLTPTPSGRTRKKTIDDDAVPNTLTSPAKLVALREQRGLAHSHSSSDLRTVSEHDTDAQQGSRNGNGTPVKANGAPKAPQRPTVGRMRRRSTLEWVNATPQTRQEKLEAVAKSRLADVFFSIHVEGVEEPVYVSEVVDSTMDPTFRHIDWSACGPGVLRLGTLTVRVWARSDNLAGWKQLLELALCLRELHYLGKSLDQFHHRLPANAVIFHLSDGIYTAFPSISDYAPPPVAPLARTTTNRVLHTASFDALLRLSKLDESIQDALATRNRIAADLETLLETNKSAFIERDQVAEAEDRLKTIEYAKKTVEKQIEKARKQKAERRELLSRRREFMQQDLQRRKAQSEEMANGKPELPNFRSEHEVRQTAIANQRRRICEDLHTIYPIKPIPGKSLAFTIRGLHLPNSEDLDATPPDKLAAALGHVAHAVHLLSIYLVQPLPYPLNPNSSTSTIEDPISLLKTSSSANQTSTKDDRIALRTYPLHTKSVPRFRFEYAVFLLNKDLQILLENAFAVRVLDIRHTLPNLLYLFYVATAGEGELPARKAGGVRGLMAGRMGAGGLLPDQLDESQLGDGSRRGSRDSRGSGGGWGFWGGVWMGNGDGRDGLVSSGNNEDSGRNGKAVDSLRRNMGGLDRGRKLG